MDSNINNKKLITLDELQIGKCGTVEALKITGNERRRLLDLGIVKGTVIMALMKSPLGNPIAYLIRGTEIALRQKDAARIFLSADAESTNACGQEINGIQKEHYFKSD